MSHLKGHHASTTPTPTCKAGHSTYIRPWVQERPKGQALGQSAKPAPTRRIAVMSPSNTMMYNPHPSPPWRGNPRRLPPPPGVHEWTEEKVRKSTFFLTGALILKSIRPAGSDRPGDPRRPQGGWRPDPEPGRLRLRPGARSFFQSGSRPGPPPG